MFDEFDLTASVLNNALNVHQITKIRAKSQKSGLYPGDFPPTPGYPGVPGFIRGYLVTLLLTEFSKLNYSFCLLLHDKEVGLGWGGTMAHRCITPSSVSRIYDNFLFCETDCLDDFGQQKVSSARGFAHGPKCVSIRQGKGRFYIWPHLETYVSPWGPK